MKKIIGITFISIIIIFCIYISYNKKNNVISYDYSDNIDLSTNNNINITSGGSYNITGSSTDASINVNTEEDIELIINNVELSNSTGPVINIENAKNTTITLVGENTINNSSDSETLEYNAVIYSKDDLIIRGEGTLKIDSKYINAIKSNDDLEINGGTITIDSKSNGIVGNDSVTVNNGNISITSLKEGLKATNEEKGNVIINGGTIKINSSEDAIQAVSDITIKDGSFELTTNEGETSSKGIKANNITIENGTFNIATEDDAIHSNNDLTISEGTFNISSNDDGIHADNNLTINNGTIDITKCYEGIEATNIIINDGTIKLVATDDGFNAAGGNDSSALNRPGFNNFSNSTGTLTINGGNILINSKGDGLDANGSINMTGGYVVVEGPTDNGNGSIDYDSNFSITGGTLITTGSSGMSMQPNSGTQSTVLINLSNTYNSNIIIKNSNNEEILNITPSKNYSSITYSSDKLVKGEYTLYIDNKEIQTFTINNTQTTVGNTQGMNGNMQQGGFQGNMPNENMQKGSMPNDMRR